MTRTDITVNKNKSTGIDFKKQLVRVIFSRLARLLEIQILKAIFMLSVVLNSKLKLPDLKPWEQNLWGTIDWCLDKLLKKLNYFLSQIH